MLDEPDGRVILFDVWDFHGETYTISLYRLRERPTGHGVEVVRTEYRMLRSGDLLRLLAGAGFTDARRLPPDEHGYYQPVYVAYRPAS